MHRITDSLLACVLCLAAVTGQAAVPPPTPEQAAASAAKKAAADAKAKLDQQALLAAMDAIADRWRANARTNGWTVHEPVPVVDPIAALKAPADGRPAPATAPAAAPAPTPKGTP